MGSALNYLSRRCSFMTSNLDDVVHQQLVVEHIFHSVFGSAACDLPTLRQSLQVRFLIRNDMISASLPVQAECV